MRSQEGLRVPETRQGGDARRKLGINHPEINTAFAEHNTDEEDLAESRRFGNAMLSARDRWQVGRINRLEGLRRIGKSEAESLLRHHLKKIGGGA